MKIIQGHLNVNGSLATVIALIGIRDSLLVNDDSCALEAQTAADFHPMSFISSPVSLKYKTIPGLTLKSSCSAGRVSK